jgi:hypothetical protein
LRARTGVSIEDRFALDLARLTDRPMLAGDARDVLAARDSLMRLLDVRPFEP